MATDAPIGARIRRRRQELGLTQRELADLVGVDESSVINWESGKHYPRRKLGKLESVLGVRLDGQDDEPVSPISAPLREVIYQELSPADAARVIEVIERELTGSGADGEAGRRAAG